MRCTVLESEGVRKSKVHTLLYTKQFSTGIYQSLTASPCNQDGREKTATECSPTNSLCLLRNHHKLCEHRPSLR